MELCAEIKKMLVKELSLDEEEVVSEAHLQDDLGADSLALLNLSTAISERYGIEMQGDDLVEIKNVGELVKLVESRISSK